MQKVIGFDVETHPFSNGNMAPKVICLAVDDGEQVRIFVGNDIETRMRELLEGQTPLVAHNASYDTSCLAATFPNLASAIWEAYDDQKIHCSLLRERLLDIAGNTLSSRKGHYALDQVAFRQGALLNIDKASPWRTRFPELENVPLAEWPSDAVEYVKTDASATKQIWEAQYKIARQGQYDAFEVESARQALYDFPLRLMSVWGVRTDEKAVQELEQHTQERITELRETLIEHKVLRRVGKKLSKNTKFVRQLVCEEIEDPPKTPTGLVQTGKDVLEKCEHPALTALIDWDKYNKAQSTYIDKLWEGVEGNMHADFRVLGAKSGRTSCARPNLQNQARGGGIRECFVPRPGHVYVLCDYDSQETRTLAQACQYLLGRSSLAEKYQADPDYDPHTNFASQLIGISYQEAMALKAEGDELILERRQQAKAANFGFPGGLGAETFKSYARGYGVRLTTEQARDLKDAWLQSIPEMPEYFSLVSELVKAGGVIEQCVSGRLRGGCTYTSAANTYFQGLASEASKTAAWLVSRACYDGTGPLYGSRPVMLIHDELILESPEEDAEDAAKELQTLMLQAMTLWCPDVPARATPQISKRWTK